MDDNPTPAGHADHVCDPAGDAACLRDDLALLMPPEVLEPKLAEILEAAGYDPPGPPPAG